MDVSRIVNTAMGWAVYLGVGALCHTHWVGASFMIDSTASWGWLLAWPVMFLLAGMKWALIAAGAVTAIMVIYVVAYWAIPPFRRWIRSL